MKSENKVTVSPIKIVLVQYGVKADALLYKNLRYLQEKFPSIPRVVLTDECRHINPKKLHGAEQFVKNNLNLTLLRDKVSHPLQFREGFWFNTIARFWLISSYHDRFPNQPILHIETDVLLMPTFPFELLNSSNFDCIFTDVSDHASSAAVLYTRNALTSKKLTEHFRSGILNNSASTDMSLLAQYREVARHRLGKFRNGSGLSPVNGETFREFPNVDPATWGMFYSGRDPKNHRGLRILYEAVPDHQIRPENLNLLIEEGRVHIENQGELVSFHIHSKDKRYFSAKGLGLLQSRIINYGGRPKIEIDLSVLIKLILLKARKYLRK